MKTVVSIGGVDYDGAARARAGFVAIDSFKRTVEGVDSLDFTVFPCCSTGFVPGVEVRLTTTDDDGANPVLRFVGDLPRAQRRSGPGGWTHNYSCPGLKARAEKVTILASDGSGTAAFNLPPQDDAYDPSLAGMTVGAIVQAVLEAPDVRAALAEVGIGGFAGGVHLPSITLADLAALYIVPPDPVQLSGQSVLNTLESFIQAWHPQFALWCEPTGILRVRSINSFQPVPVQLAGDGGFSDGVTDPVDGLNFEINTDTCFTRYEIIGVECGLFYGSTRLGTLAPAWTAKDQKSWTIRDYTTPDDAVDQGSISDLTPTSCTIHSDYPKSHWDAQYWPSVGGSIMFVDSVSGAYQSNSDVRTITSCTAMTAGGSSAITWDNSQPLNSSSFNHYRLEGLRSPKAVVGRLYDLRDPATGDVGLKTWAGAHLRNRMPRPMWYGNSSARSQITTATAKVQWSADGKSPYYELPIPVEVVRNAGQILLTEPAVQLSATPMVLQNGYPASEGAGAPHDVIAYVPYSLGTLIASAPVDAGYSGTAFTRFGIQRTRKLPIEAFNDRGALTLMRQLAAEKLACFHDAVATGSFDWIDTPTAFDAMQMGYAVSLSVPDYPLEIAGLALPVRSVTWSWSSSGGLTTSIEFSNLQRPFEGDDLFIHPGYGTSSLTADFESAGSLDDGGMGDYGAETANEFDNFDDHDGGGGHHDNFMSDWRPGRAAAPAGPSRQDKIDATARKHHGPHDPQLSRQERTDAVRDDVRSRAADSPAEHLRKQQVAGKVAKPAMGGLQTFDDAPSPTAIRTDDPQPQALADRDRDVFGEEI